jgi:hypothetical protein
MGSERSGSLENVAALSRAVAPRRARLRTGGWARDAELLALQQAAANRAVARAARDWNIRVPPWVLARPTRNPFADPAASRDAPSAAKALDQFLELEADAQRECVRASYKKDPAAPREPSRLARVLAALSKGDQLGKYRDALARIGRIVEEEETRASANVVSDEQIAAALGTFRRTQAVDALTKKASKNAPPPTTVEVEAERRRQVASTSTKPAAPTGWYAMKPKEREEWIERGHKAVTKLVGFAAKDKRYRELGIRESHFRVAFEDFERRSANAIAFSEGDGAGGFRCGIGFAFVNAVELGSDGAAYVMDLVVHELFGHPSYDSYEYHLFLYDAAMASLDGYVAPAAGSPERDREFGAYGYPETEIYALLVSMPYRTAPNPRLLDNPLWAYKVPRTDTQNLVTYRVGMMTRQWPRELIVPILRGLRARLGIDPRITRDALDVFDRAVRINLDNDTSKKICT